MQKFFYLEILNKMFNDIIIFTKSKNTARNIEILFREKRLVYEYCLFCNLHSFILYSKNNSKILVTELIYTIKRYNLYYSVLNPNIIQLSKLALYNIEKFLFKE